MRRCRNDPAWAGGNCRQQSRFLTDIGTIRERARKQIADGAVTPSYGANRLQVLRLLNDALASEIVCVLRYRRHYFMVTGAAGEAIKGELMEHSLEEQSHTDLIAEVGGGRYSPRPTGPVADQS